MSQGDDREASAASSYFLRRAEQTAKGTQAKVSGVFLQHIAQIPFLPPLS